MHVVIRKADGPMRLTKGESIFLVRRRTAALRMEVMARLRKENDGVLTMSQVLEETDKACLLGWENVKDEAGNPVPCDRCPCCTVETQSTCGPCGGTGSLQEASWHLLDDGTWDDIVTLAREGLTREESRLGNS